MDEALLFIADFTPYVIGALLLGLTLAVSLPWLWKHPERWFFFVIFTLCIPGIGQTDTATEGSVFKQISWSGLFALGLLRFLWHEKGRMSFDFSYLPLGLVVLVCYISLSIAWSPYPAISLRRVVQVIGVLFIGLIVARQALQGQGLLAQSQWPVGLFILFGLASAVVSPDIAFDSDRAMRGISSHKNTWGQFSLMAGLIYLSALSERHGKQRMLLLAAMLGLSALSILLSRSTTSLLCFLFIAGTLTVWAILTRWGVTGKILLTGLVALILIALHVYFVSTGELPFERLSKLVYSSTGKNETLTGRDFLWYLMQVEIARHPWLGTGFGGFWTGTEGASGALVARLDWGPPQQAHNGYLDVINEIGFVGMGLLAITLLIHVANIAHLSRRCEYSHAFFHGSLLIAALFINYTETSLLRTTHFWWIAICVSIVEVHVRLRHASLVSAPSTGTVLKPASATPHPSGNLLPR